MSVDLRSSAYADPFMRSIERFVEVIGSGDRSRIFCPPRDAMQTLAVAIACGQALETGSRAFL